MAASELASDAADQAPFRSFDKSRTALVRRARAINRILATTYPDAHIELDFSTPLELLVATILSAQSTDKRVNLVTPIALRSLSRRRRVRRRRPCGSGGAHQADRLLSGQDRHLDQARGRADRALRR